MNECLLPGGITALACAIAKDIKKTNDLFLLAAVFGQLGAALNTIASQRSNDENTRITSTDAG